MIVYVNGDSHSAGAEAVNKFGFAHDDPQYANLGRRPHPENLRASYGALVADTFNAELYCDAESASSNSRIMRDRKSTRLNSSHTDISRMPSSA